MSRGRVVRAAPRRSTRPPGAAVLALVALVGLTSACGGGGGHETTLAKIQRRGEVRIGVRVDVPGFGQRNPATNQLEGFDIQIARFIAARIFATTPDKVGAQIRFVEAAPKNREELLRTGAVDMVVANYLITGQRKQVVDFAGPYYVGHADILVRTSVPPMTSVDDLNGRKVCAQTGSSAAEALKAKAPGVDLVALDTYNNCVAALNDGRVDGVAGEALILATFAQRSGGSLRLANTTFSDEPYGIGIKKGDEGFRTVLNDSLEEMAHPHDWASAFDATLAPIGLPRPSPPAVDRSPSPAPPS